MDNRWGLTAENSKNSGLFRNKPIFGFQLSPTLNPNATATNNSSSNTGIMFTDKKDEVFMSNIVGRSDHRVALGEVDFFSVMKIRAHDSALKRGGGDSLDESRGMDVNTGLQLVTANTGSTDQSTIDDSISSDIEDKRTKVELAQLQVELERMKSENWKLKETLTQVTNKYSTLQTHFMTIMQQQQQHNLRPQNPLNHEVHVDTNTKEGEDATIIRPRQFMDLVSSGNTENDEPTFNESSSEERTLSASTLQKNDSSSPRNKGILKREESPMSEGCPPPNKVPKFSNNSNSSPVADHAAATTSVTTVRKARVSVRARSEAPMIGDGCQWRKYGQKMAKGNPCPRAYYRCTMSVGCPVRKQVQRCAEDRGVLITTYEGNHNHPLPPAAMAMASTTAAAASMLMSGSMSSADGLMNTNILARTLLPPSSSNMATISASAPIPTVTLDLTRNPVDHPLQNYQTTPPHHFPLPLNFVPGNSPMPHQVFPYVNQSNFSGLHRSPETEGASGPYSNGHNYMQQHPQNHHHASLSDTLSAATAAITADPNFTAALAAAISSIIGGSNHSNNSNNNQMASSTENTAMVRNDN